MQGPIAGHDAAGLYGNIWRMFPDFRFEIRRLIGNRDELSIEWVAEGEYRCGGHLELSGIHLLSFQDGELVALRAYFETALLIPFLARNRLECPAAA